jgi:hypothetical protein
MRTRKIGNLEVSAVGLGTMGFSHGYGPGVGDDEAVDLMRKAFDLGCELTEEEFGRIEAELAKIEIHGNRTDEDIATLRDLQ